MKWDINHLLILEPVGGMPQEDGRFVRNSESDHRMVRMPRYLATSWHSPWTLPVTFMFWTRRRMASEFLILVAVMSGHSEVEELVPQS